MAPTSFTARAAGALSSQQARLRPHLPALVPGLLAVGLLLVWAVHNGGYDTETWYWGALAFLGLLAAVASSYRRNRLDRPRIVALGLFGGYVAWCYLSMLWAQSPGDALQGANQALMYLMIFALALILPWTAEAGLAVLVVFASGVGVIGVVLLVRLASADHVVDLFIEGRLAAPTGYENSTAALFTIETLTAIGLAARRELPGMVRGLMLAFACCSLQLALIVQSRGWLFTLPLVALVAIVASDQRLRVAAAAIVPIAGTVVIVHRLLGVYQSSSIDLNQAAVHAGRPAVFICAAAFVLGTLVAWADDLHRGRPLSPRTRRIVGTGLSVAVVLALGVGGVAATHGHPLRFVSREWNGFSHEQTSFSTTSHFGDVGSGRYDFWRVALDAFASHPITGLGEDNFADYYLVHRRTGEEPSWTHSLEMRLLAQTGVVGFALMACFLILALWLAAGVRRGGDRLTRGVAGIALLPVTVWLIHGSIDWFWEMPALSGPALGFLGMAAGLGARSRTPVPAQEPVRGDAEPPRPLRLSPVASTARGRIADRAPVVAGVLALLGGVIVLGFPYLSAREVSLGSDASATDTSAALSDFALAARLDPLSSVPGRLAGAIALQAGEYAVAQQRFRQSVAREPGGWFSWLGEGLAASALGRREQARRDFAAAYGIDSKQPVTAAALARVDARQPLTSDEAFKLLVVAQ